MNKINFGKSCYGCGKCRDLKETSCTMSENGIECYCSGDQCEQVIKIGCNNISYEE